MTTKYVIGAIVLILLIIFGFIFNNRKNQQIDQSRIFSPTDSTAYFAGGCFWCVESDFEKLNGVSDAISGYMGGERENPTYQDHADHRETVEVRYDASKVSYKNLVQYFFRHHDPTDEGGSFVDRGFSYTSAIYPQTEEEQTIALAVIAQLEEEQVFENPIVTAVEMGKTFWIAEDYHQNYYQKNPIRYNGYRFASGRDQFIEQVWGERDDFEIKTISSHQWQDFEKPSKEELRELLSELAFDVTQNDATEKPFSEGNFDSNKEQGIYVDIISGEPLFSSRDKFDSGTGWPSFTRPISSEFVQTQADYKLILPRTEVRSTYADSHLGHVFSDGPEPTGQRWCMNGAALDFVPLEQMEEMGYGDYLDEV